MVKAIFFDVDGTVVSHTQKAVPKSTRMAMGNAPENVKEIADFVTDSVDDDGIAKALAVLGVLK